MFFRCSVRSPHRTAKPSRGCLPLAHPRRALPAVVVFSDRRSPSAMCEFPFECWGCFRWIWVRHNTRWHVTIRVAWLASVGGCAFSPQLLLHTIPSVSRAWLGSWLKARAEFSARFYSSSLRGPSYSYRVANDFSNCVLRRLTPPFVFFLFGTSCPRQRSVGLEGAGGPVGFEPVAVAGKRDTTLAPCSSVTPRRDKEPAA